MQLQILEKKLKKNSYVIRGVAHWAKVLGEPVMNYGGDNREWTVDLSPDEDGMRLVNELGLEGRLKEKGDERGQFMAFRQREKRLDGSLNRRISVVDSQNNPWPQDRLIGNGSVVEIRFDYRDYGKGKQPGVYPQAIRVLDHKEYAPVHFAPLSEDDPYAAKDFHKDFGLDDPNAVEEFPE